MNWHIAAFILALVISYLATPWVRRAALALNVMVQPGGRRVHTRPMPLWGGVAIYGAFALTCVATVAASRDWRMDAPMQGLLIAGAIIVTLGMIDDVKELSALTQTAAIILAAVVLMQFGVRIQFLTNPLGAAMIVLPFWLSVLMTIAWIFLVTKTVDFMDGLDGLAAGIGAVAAGALAIMAFYSPHQQFVALMAAALCGACLGFLRFNFNPAKIFMGTGGSQFVGFALAAVSIVGAFKVAAAMAIALPVLVLGVPIFDGLFVVARRLMRGQPIHVADRSHLHHRLMERGFSHKQAVMLMIGLTLALCVIAILLWRIR